MKVNSIHTKCVELTITLENIEEIEAFHQVMNFSPICNFLRSHEIEVSAIRTAISPNGGFICPSPLGKVLKKWFNEK